MKILLERLAPTTRGIYNTKAGPDTLPERFRFLWPTAAEGFRALEAETGGLIYSDILRSAEESLHALQTKTGVQPPSYSGHNFGFSVDVAVDETLRLRKWTYEELLEVMAAHGWHCHRRDGKRGSEAWHFNFFGDAAPVYLGVIGGWSAPLEKLIQEVYGPGFLLTNEEVQVGLRKLSMYFGDIDGILGPRTKQGLMAFQRAWRLPASGVADPRTKRVLAFVAADREIV